MYDFERFSNMQKITALKIPPNEMTYERITHDYILKKYSIDLSIINTGEDFSNFLNSIEYFEKYKDCKSIDEFYAKFCFREFKLFSEPSTKLNQIKTKINSAIHVVDGIIKKYENKLNSLSTINLYSGTSNIENIHNNKELLSTFIGKNKLLLERQHNFIDNDLDNACIWESMGGIDSVRIQALTSQYSLRITSDIILMHKYGDFSAATDEYPNIRQAYEDNLSGKENSYIQQMEEYIKERDVLNELNKHINKSHILNEQHELITTAINLYKDGKYAAFSWIIVSVLEYILNQLCLINNASVDDLTNKGMKMKFEKLQNIAKYPESRIYFSEYFHDVLPFIRNKISHGWYSSNDSYIYILSSHLLLDLRSLCEALMDCKCKLNNDIAYLTLIKKRNKIDLNSKDFIHFLHVVNDKLAQNELSDFYDFSDTYNMATKHFSSDTFLDNIKLYFADLSDENIREAMRIIHGIEKLTDIDSNIKASAQRAKQELVCYLKEKAEKRKKTEALLKKLKRDLIEK